MFEKTQAAASNHTDEEIAQEVDLKPAEVTAPGTDQPETTPEVTPVVEPEETVEELKARLKKTEEDRDNYKQMGISAKARDRSFTPPVAQVVAPVVSEAPPEVDLSEQAVLSVLEKQHERKVLRDVIDPRSTSYIPELVDDNQYSEIIGYLPRNLDKSNPDTIVRALKIATKLWKEDNNIEDKPVDKGKVVQANLATGKTASTAGPAPVREQPGRKIIKSSTPMSDWYKK